MKKLKSTLLVIFYFAFSLVFLGLGIYKLCGFNETCQTTLVGAVEFFENEHSINGLIPIGTSYYYLGITNNGELVVIQANPNWLNNNFDANGYAKNAQGITVKGEIKHLSYNSMSYVNDVLADYSDYNMPLGQSYCMNVLYMDNTIHSIIAGSLVLLLGIATVILRKKESLKERLTQNKALFVGSIIIVILILFYLVHVATLCIY